MLTWMRKTLIKSLTIAPIALLTACGGGGGGGLFDDTTGSSNLNPASITISATKPLVQTNGTDSTTLTVTVKNSGSLGLADIPVEIRKDGDIGNLTVAAATTDANGQVTATLTGDSSYSNGIVTISARVTGTALSASAPIVFNGSTLTVNSDVISAQVGSRSTLIYTVKNATESGIYNTPVCLDFDAALIRAEGALTQTSNCANAILTDINGSASVDLVGLATGSSVVRATASGEAVSTTVSLTTPDITFTSPSGAGTDTAAFDAGLPVSVRVPGYTGVVRLATSLGTWDGVNNVIEVTASGESASATLRPGNMQGKANITATKLSGGSITSTSVFFYDTSSLANATIKLEATPNVLTAGADGTSSQLVATVMKRDGSGAITVPAVNAPVSFRIMQSAGGTEYIAAAYDETDTSGQAISQFFAGSTASAAGGVVVEACVVGQPVPCSEAAITLTQKSGSITIGNSTTVTPIADNTAYEWPISVLVTDINGTTPVKNATVSLSVWPVEFRTGCWDDEAEVWLPAQARSLLTPGTPTKT